MAENAEGRVRVVVLELDGRCISDRLGLLEQGRLYDYNLAFLAQYAGLGAGRVRLDEWIRRGLDERWQHIKPRLQQWRAKRAAAVARLARTPVVTGVDKKIAPTAHPMEDEHASPSHSQR